MGWLLLIKSVLFAQLVLVILEATAAKGTELLVFIVFLELFPTQWAHITKNGSRNQQQCTR